VSTTLKRIFGVCHVPRIAHGYESPLATLKSFRALRAVGINEVRLSYTQDTPQLKAAFAIDYANIDAAGLTKNINAGPRWTDAAGNRIKPDPAEVEAWAFEMASKFPARIYTFENEPGALAQLYEAQNGGDFMVDAYMPAFLAFVNGVLRADPKASFGGCDADSVEIQARFIELCRKSLPGFLFQSLRRRVHPYGDGFANQRYSTMEGDPENEGYAHQADNLPLDIGEIGVAGDNNFEGNVPLTEADLGRLLMYLERIDAQYPVGQIDLLGPEYFFTRLPNPPDTNGGPTWSTWTYNPKTMPYVIGSEQDAPVVSDFGVKLAQHIAKVNGLPVHGRGPGSGRRSAA
jgi:hypothetical protein